MKKSVLSVVLGVFILLFVVVSFILSQQLSLQSPNSLSNQENETPRMGMGNNMGMGGVMTTDLTPSNQIAKELQLPPLLDGTSTADGGISYAITASEGNTSLLEGNNTQTLGYNGSILGPVIRIRKDQNVTIQTENELNTATSFHWHGLKVPSNVDGGPHTPIEANETAELEFTVKQEAATLWFHPHPEGQTGEQVYNGLAGLIYIEDENSDILALPKEYGTNDFPLIVQDRKFDEDNQLNYNASSYNKISLNELILL